jgi:hypothetical protein
VSHRRQLPQCRASVNFDLSFGGIGQSYQITVGFYDDGTIGEVFINGGKTGTDMEAIARDGAILFSLAKQYGAELENIKRAITRNEQGEPSSIIGAVVDQLSEPTKSEKEHERTDFSERQSAARTDGDS